LRFLVDQIAERNGVSEEVAADGGVDARHLDVEKVRLWLQDKLGFVGGQPSVVVKRDALRDNPLRKNAKKLEERIGRKSAARLRHHARVMAVVLDDSDGVKVFLNEEMDVLKDFGHAPDGQSRSESHSGQCTSTQNAKHAVALSAPAHFRRAR